MSHLYRGKVLDTPTPASTSGLPQTIGRMKPSARGQSAHTGGVTGNEARRTDKRVTHELDAISSSDDEADGYDSHSPRYGDGGRRGRELDDDLSIQIPLRHGQQQAARDHTDDLSSISFDRTLSPRRESPQRHSMARTHDSPVSHFDSMARNLRGALDDVLQSGYGAGQTTAAGLSSIPKLGSPNVNNSRRVFGNDLGNTILTSSPPPQHAPERSKSYTLPVAPVNRPRAASPPARPRSAYAAAPTPARPREHRMPDITGLTEGLLSPEKIRGHRAPPPEQRRPADDGPLAANLAHLQHKLERLEDVNDRSTQRIHQLEDAIVKDDAPARPRPRQRSPDHDSGFGSGGSNFGEPKHQQTELEAVVQRLRSHVYRLGQSLSTQAEAIAELRGHARHRGASSEEVETLRRRVDVLETEVDEVRKLTEAMRSEQREEALRQAHQRERVRQDSESARSPRPASTHFERAAPAHFERPRQRERARPASVRANESDLDRELKRAEAILSSVPRDHDGYTCSICRRRQAAEPEPEIERPRTASPRLGSQSVSSAKTAGHHDPIPPQAILARVLRDLEDDFASSKVIFTELTDAYKRMDPASDANQRRTLAKHLKENVDVLEQKADQIKSFYDLLHYRDSPNPLPPHVRNAADHLRR